MIFASTMLYAVARKMGLEPAQAEFMRQVRKVTEWIQKPDGEGFAGGAPPAYIPAAFTLARAALLDDVQIHINAGATVIAKGRNISAHAFLESPCDVWLSCDDDVEVSAVALAAMVAQAKQEACWVVAPCLLRETLTVNIEERRIAFEFTGAKGARFQRIAGGGFGCVAVSRRALQIYLSELDAVPLWQHTDGVTRPVLFRDELVGTEWYTEDTAFFRRVPASLPVYAVRAGHTVHNGQILDLETLEALAPKT